MVQPCVDTACRNQRAVFLAWSTRLIRSSGSPLSVSPRPKLPARFENDDGVDYRGGASCCPAESWPTTDNRVFREFHKPFLLILSSHRHVGVRASLSSALAEAFAYM